MDAVGTAGSLVACLVMMGAAALAGWRIDEASRRRGGADDYFWIAFGGAAVIAGAGSVAALPGGPGIVLALVVGLVSSAAAVGWAWWRHGRRSRAVAESLREAVWADLRRRHDEVIRRWADYELDPWKAIRYPAMHDSGQPEGRAVVRALRAAAESGTGAHSSGEEPADPVRYAEAVAGLEQAFERAEQRVGACREGSGARHRGVPVDLQSLPPSRLQGTLRG
ncbi:hypothetical protein [Arthrobacter sp. NPDC092385]|uniref:hypothetical protein n=1 Tax=Arthrobacter sp. NPDC092385 TaxID=3363943 RepID=UPI0038157992